MIRDPHAIPITGPEILRDLYYPSVTMTKMRQLNVASMERVPAPLPSDANLFWKLALDLAATGSGHPVLSVHTDRLIDASAPYVTTIQAARLSGETLRHHPNFQDFSLETDQVARTVVTHNQLPEFVDVLAANATNTNHGIDGLVAHSMIFKPSTIGPITKRDHLFAFPAHGFTYAGALHKDKHVADPAPEPELTTVMVGERAIRAWMWLGPRLRHRMVGLGQTTYTKYELSPPFVARQLVVGKLFNALDAQET